MDAQDDFRGQVQRLVAEGKLTAEEAAELLNEAARPPQSQAAPAAPAAPASPASVGPESYTIAPIGDAEGTPNDLILSVSGYSLSVILDPGVSQVMLSANRPEELRLSATPTGWRVERNHRQAGIWPALKAILSVPFAPVNARAEINGGNLNLCDLTGEARLEVSGGNLRMQNAGSLDADVNGGNLNAERISGPADARVNGGNLTLTYAESLNATVNGGNLTWAGRLITGDHRVEVNGGNATLRLSPDSSVRLSADVTVGSFKADFPTSKSGDMISSHYEGALGGGAALLSGAVTAGRLRLETPRELS